MRPAALTFSVVFLLAPAGCSSFSQDIADDDECVESFLEATESSSELRLPLPGEEAAGAFQAADEWEGETPVCWVNFRLDDVCSSFMYDLEGRWAEAAWVSSGHERSPACAREAALPGAPFLELK